MFKYLFFLLTLIAVLSLDFRSELFARTIDNWSYERLFRESDLVVIATAIATKASDDTFVDDRWPLAFVGRNTTLQVLQVCKGKVPGKEIAVLHFTFGKLHKKAAAQGNSVIEIIDAPHFVSFQTKRANVEIAGMALSDYKFEYLLFLKARDDGRFEPVSGRIDPDCSVRELFEPFFSRDPGHAK